MSQGYCTNQITVPASSLQSSNVAFTANKLVEEKKSPNKHHMLISEPKVHPSSSFQIADCDTNGGEVCSDSKQMNPGGCSLFYLRGLRRLQSSKQSFFLSFLISNHMSLVDGRRFGSTYVPEPTKAGIKSSDRSSERGPLLCLLLDTRSFDCHLAFCFIFPAVAHQSVKTNRSLLHVKSVTETLVGLSQLTSAQTGQQHLNM